MIESHFVHLHIEMTRNHEKFYTFLVLVIAQQIGNLTPTIFIFITTVPCFQPLVARVDRWARIRLRAILLKSRWSSGIREMWMIKNGVRQTTKTEKTEENDLWVSQYSNDRTYDVSKSIFIAINASRQPYTRTPRVYNNCATTVYSHTDRFVVT